MITARAMRSTRTGWKLPAVLISSAGPGIHRILHNAGLHRLSIDDDRVVRGMGEGQSDLSLTVYLTGTDKFQFAGLFVIIEQVRKESGILLIHIHSKRRPEAKLTVIGKCQVDGISLSGDIVDDLHRNRLPGFLTEHHSEIDVLSGCCDISCRSPSR